MNEIIAAIIGGIIGIAGAVISSIITTDRQRIIIAGYRLRLAFHDELAALRHGTDDAHDILTEVSHFRMTISSYKQPRIYAYISRIL